MSNQQARSGFIFVCCEPLCRGMGKASYERDGFDEECSPEDIVEVRVERVVWNDDKSRVVEVL